MTIVFVENQIVDDAYSEWNQGETVELELRNLSYRIPAGSQVAEGVVVIADAVSVD